MAFDWSTQFAHWMLEHVPRVFYLLELCRVLPQPPLSCLILQSLLLPALLAH